MMRFKLTVAALFGLLLFFGLADAGAVSWWGDMMPHAASDYGDRIDRLYYFIYAVTGLTFLGVQGLLVWYCIKYREREGNAGIYSHGSHKLEVAWTLAPALMLLVLALVQQSAWMDIKTRFPRTQPLDGSQPPVRIEVLGRQFNWFFRYPGQDRKFNTHDDVVSSTLVIPANRNILVQLRSEDVLHSFFLPYHRVKQDAVPGLSIPVWFRSAMTSHEYAIKHNKPLIGPRPWSFEVACAELCGQGHTDMRAAMEVLTRREFDAWLAGKSEPWKTARVTKEQHAAQFVREREDKKKHWGWAWAPGQKETVKTGQYATGKKQQKGKKDEKP